MQAQESYGRVTLSSTSTPIDTFNSAGTNIDSKSKLRRRRNESDQYQDPTQIRGEARSSHKKSLPKETFLHNGPIGILVTLPFISIAIAVLFGLIPPFSSRLSSFIVLMGRLGIYAFDLTNNRDGVFLTIWVFFILVSMSLLADFIFVRENVGAFGSYSDSGTNGNGDIFYHTIRLLKLGLSIMHIFCLSVWETLQLSSLFLDSDLKFISLLEQFLFAIAPLTFSASMTYFSWVITIWVPHDYIFIDNLWIPHLFSIFLSFSVWLVGNLPPSFNTSDYPLVDYSKGNKPNQQSPIRILKRHYAILHVSLLLTLPPLIHLVSMNHRLLVVIPSKHHVYDFLLTVTIPTLLLTILKYNSITFYPIKSQISMSSPSKAQKYKDLYDASIFQSFNIFHDFLTTKLAGISIAVIALIVHDRYILDLCSSSSLYFHGNVYPSYIITMLLLGAYTCIFLCYLIPKSKVEFIQRYSKDLSDFFLVLALIFIQLALAIPIDSAPVILLSSISIIAFISTRQMMYILVSIIAVGAHLYFQILLRLSFASASLSSGMSLFSFMVLCVVAMLLLILTVGLVYRDPTDIFSSVQIDATGTILSAYTALLSFFEAMLTSENLEQNILSLQPFPIYPLYLPPITSVILFLIAMNLSQNKALSNSSFLIISCISAGKVLPTTIHNSNVGKFMHILVTSAVLFTVFAPYVFLHPVHKTVVKTDKAMWQLQNHVLIYSASILPIAILFSHTTVITPIIYLISEPRTSLSSNVGLLVSMWGFLTTSLVTYIFPNGGADSIKKTGVISLFIGVLITLIQGKNPKSLRAVTLTHETTVHTYTKSRWGLVVSALAYLLVLTGPLQPIDKKTSSRSYPTQKQPSLTRITIFSIIFGCGIAWFVSLEIMEDCHLVPIILTTISCMVIACLGTVLSVLAYYLDLRHIRELFKLTQLTIIVFPMFLGVCLLSMVMRSTHLFGLGGCLSGYFSVCAFFSFSFSVALKVRDQNEKNSTTQNLGNIACVVSYIFCNLLLFGHFGVMKIGTFDGIGMIDTPSIIGTALLSLILLLLEGKSSKLANGKLRMNHMPPMGAKKRLYTVLTKSNMYAVPIASTSSIFFLATIYVIFLRGCVSSAFGRDDSGIQTSYEDVFGFIYGSSNRVTTLLGEDVASMARRKYLHTNSVSIAAKLAGSGFCTSEKVFGPFLHLFGTLAIFPSSYNLLMYLLLDVKKPFRQIISILPFNLLPLFFCIGIPFLQANALLNLVGGIVQISTIRKDYWNGRMRI